MSFMIHLEKNAEGVLEVTSQSGAEYLPASLDINGHVEGEQVVDVGVRVAGLSAYSSRR